MQNLNLKLGEAVTLSRVRYENLVREAKKISNDEEKLSFLINYFLNRLNPEEVKIIDGTNDFIPFIFDYSFLYNLNEDRVQHYRDCETGLIYSAEDAMNDKNKLLICSSDESLGDSRIDPIPQEYGTALSSKMATCIILANTFQRLMFDVFVKNPDDYNTFNKYAINNLCKIVCKKGENCYDFYEGHFRTTDKDVKIDRVVPMVHYYNIVYLGNKKYKVDLAGTLMAMDYAKNNELKDVDLSDFIREFRSENDLERKTLFDKIAEQGQPGDH